MAVTDAQIAHAHDLFAGLGNITSRKMMGGLSIYCDGTIFACIGPGDRLYIKAKGTLADEMAALGSVQFGYDNNAGNSTGMPYWTLPETALDDPDEAQAWGRKALAALK